VSVKDFSKRTYTVMMTCLIIGIVAVLWCSEWFAFLQAHMYVSFQHRQGEAVFSDESARWLSPLPQQVMIPEKGLPSTVLEGQRPFWLIEHVRTGLKGQLTPRWQCKQWLFGARRLFRVRRCHPHNGVQRHLNANARKATYLMNGKPCRWRGSRCRFGHRWRWAGPLPDFPSGGDRYKCVRIHPVSNGWTEVHFPPVPMQDGVRIGYGFSKRVGSYTPMRVQLQLRQWPDKIKSKTRTPRRFVPTLHKTLMDRWIEHHSFWHSQYWKGGDVALSRGGISMRIWTKNNGAKAFCVQVVAYQPKKALERALQKRIKKLVDRYPRLKVSPKRRSQARPTSRPIIVKRGHPSTRTARPNKRRKPSTKPTTKKAKQHKPTTKPNKRDKSTTKSVKKRPHKRPTSRPHPRTEGRP